MKIVYIHGATASRRSFAFIDSCLQSDAIYLDYDREYKASYNLDSMRERLIDVQEKLYYVTHSLGGIYAVYLQNDFSNSIGCVSLATPFNGSEIAAWSRMFVPGYSLFADITPGSLFISKSMEINIRIPWTQFVTTTGDVPWLVGHNDGVVTRQSMMCRDDVNYIEIDRNHYEIVQSQRVVDYLKTHITHKEKYDE